MDMSMGANMFQTPNMALARIYWYLVAAVVALFVAVRAVNYYDSSIRLRTSASASYAYPTKPRTPFLQSWATATAVAREITYPQFFVSVPYLSWLTPPPAGRLIILLVYWAVILGFMCAGAIVHDVNFYERIGFRNAWVTVTQLPLLYLLAGKTSVIASLTGTSHERLNWMHRWIARTMFVTASVHGWHFYTEYRKAGLASYFFEVMPMGKYGIAAWGLLLWSFVVGVAPIRHLCYEVFVIQHIATACLLLWAVHKHVPSYAEYNVWFAVAALGFDRVVRFLMLVFQNIKLATPDRARCKGGRRIGHDAQVRAVGDDIAIVTIKDVHFTWRAGQHLYLWIPALGPLEHHPYTIACAHVLPETCVCNSVQLVVRKHGGFSKRLHDRAAKDQAAAKKTTLTAFVTGPFGEPARWDIYETLVLISASTGASFTLPILESVLQAAADDTRGGKKKAICTKRIDFLLSAKKGDEIGYYVGRLHELLDKAKTVGIELSVSIAVTRDKSPLVGMAPSAQSHNVPQSGLSDSYSSSSSVDKTAKVATTTITPGEQSSACCMATPDAEKTAAGLRKVASNDSHVQQLATRPDIAAFVRNAVETTGGETSVVVCGGKSLVARTRNCVAQLSDERAVHKGTGAQGIHLHVEEYGF
ncbi:ferric-chelate reductase [Ophiostoma piceae UAMH 11346]|uniref:ferric-chelate reductase (NADPH) n=1 Tax=Ophiostoma piceae (strain UAMH 11346) TaxID=1262450 RepID=S3CGK2_OPHP1|nr:ferric-chelate reductase [Ophiostoma piceae UAMH 11346]